MPFPFYLVRGSLGDSDLHLPVSDYLRKRIVSFNASFFRLGPNDMESVQRLSLLNGGKKSPVILGILYDCKNVNLCLK